MQPTIDMLSSPYERGAAVSAPALVQLKYAPKQRWVPSRYNARTVGDDGRLLLWNTYTGTITTFLPRDRERVLEHLSVGGISEPLDKVGTYLSKRGYLVRDDVDEMMLFRYSYARQQWRTDKLQFILLASEDCNFRCVYCYEKFERGTMLPEVRQGVRELVLKQAPHLRELGFSWFGGEPLYGWEAIEDLAPFAKAVAEEHGIRLSQNMTTNGYLLSEERATKLLEWGCRQFQITVDGLPEEHNCKRIGRDGSPTYDVILDNLRSLRDREDRFQVDLRVNFDNKNFPRLGAFMESLSEDFAGDRRFQLRFRAVGKWGGANDNELDTCGITEKRTVQRELSRRAEELELAQEAGIGNVAALGSQVCYAARPYNFIVGASGALMKCTVALYDLDTNVVGHLNPDGTVQLDAQRMSQWVGPHFETDSMCQSCYVLPGCQGAACPITRITEGKRTCCSVKSELKQEMRFTLATAAKRRESLAGAAS